MSTQLIPVFNGTISNETTLLVNARDLHEFLGVRRDFSTWIKNRITEYGFLIDSDYILVHQNGGIKSGRGGDRRSKDYHLTLDTAKELAMVERNEKGRQVRRYFIECEKRLHQKLRQPVNPPSEPLSPNDMANLKRLVWMMTKGMKFEGSWNSGVWYALRSATGRPSPQPFTVDDLPALGEECRRILKITTAFNSAVYDFERDLIRKVVRRREALEPLLREMNNKAMEIQHKESEGLLLLGKFEEHGVKGLVSRA